MRRIVFILALMVTIMTDLRPVNAAGYQLTRTSESCVLKTYRDPKGVLTAGYGHTGDDVRAGMPVTQDMADKWFAQDLDAKAGAAVTRLVTVPLNDNQFAALADFVFNVGEGAFARSVLLMKLNRSEYDAVPGQLALWVKVTKNGKKVTEPGLMKRRAAEAALWNTPVDPPAPPAAPEACALPADPHEGFLGWLLRLFA